MGTDAEVELEGRRLLVDWERGEHRPLRAAVDGTGSHPLARPGAA